MADIAPHWYEVGAMLLKEEEEAKLKLIKSDNGSDSKKCCLAMLQYWMDAYPAATWHQLVTTLRLPGVDLATVASNIEKNFIGKLDLFICISFLIFLLIVDHIHRSVETFTDVDFTAFKNVKDAFDALTGVFKNVLSDADFETIHVACLKRANEMRNEMGKITNNYELFKLLACDDIHFNWMNISYLNAMASASGNKRLQDLVKKYDDVILSKTLGEVWNFIPSFNQIKEKYYSKVKAKFKRKNPNNVTIKDLIKYAITLAQEIALAITEVKGGSLTISWCILTKETYRAYLLALSVPQELRKDDFLQIGPWVVFHPQLVIQNLRKAHG